MRQQGEAQPQASRANSMLRGPVGRELRQGEAQPQASRARRILK